MTNKGFVGITQHAINTGDDVAVFHGCGVPVILRGHSGGISYRLIGGAYIAGLMRGELVDGSVSGVEIRSISEFHTD